MPRRLVHSIIHNLSIAFIVCWAAVTYGEEPTSNAVKLCVVRDPLIQEASGLAVSHNVDNAVWMHNDSGHEPRLFLVSMTGNTLGIANVQGTTAHDWEDLCSFQLDGESWLLVGDIGDNARNRSLTTPGCRLLLLKEPKMNPGVQKKKTQEVSVDVMRTIEFQFPDGPHDCESLAVDTTSRTILLITKTDPLNCAMYSLPLTLTRGRETLKADYVTAIGATFATAMDVSPDGRQLVVVNMFTGVMVTRDNPKKETWSDAFSKKATVLTLPKRKQGESVCFTADGDSLLLNSEGESQPLWQVKAAAP